MAGVRVAGATLTLLALAALSGCRAEVGTALAASSAQATVSATIAQAPAALDPGTPAAAALTDAFRSRTGSAPTIVRSDGTVRASVEVPVSELGRYQDVTGVVSAVTETVGETSTVTVRMGRAQALVDAVAQAADGEPDPAAAAAAMLAVTTTSVSVTVNGAAEATLDGPGVVSQSTDGSTVTVVRPATDGEAVLTVSSAPAASKPWGLLAVAAAAVLAGVGLRWLRAPRSAR